MRALLGILFFATANAVACGYCVEDKIAATYDHAVVMTALAQGHHIAYFHVEGAVARGKLQQAAYSAGADHGSVRVAPDALTLAAAYDPRRVRLAELQSRIEKRAAGASLMPLRVMENAADLKSVGR